MTPCIRLDVLFVTCLVLAQEAKADTVYVGSSGADGGSIEVFDSSGTWLETFARGSFKPWEMAWGADGMLYMVDLGSWTEVTRFDSSGNSLGPFATGLDQASDLVFDSANQLYVADVDRGTVERFASDGTHLGTFVTGLVDPMSLDFDSRGLLYVLHGPPRCSVIEVFDSTGASAGVLAGADKWGVAVDADDNVYFLQNGNFMRRDASGTALGVFNEDIHIGNFVVGQSGNLYASQLLHVQPITPTGESGGVVARVVEDNLLGPIGGLAVSPSVRHDVQPGQRPPLDLGGYQGCDPYTVTSDPPGGFGQPIPEGALGPGDADQDMDFDPLDLILTLQSAKYLTGEPALWSEGDWDGAPGGEPGNPPVGNGQFDQLDIIAALTAEIYETGPYGPGGLEPPQLLTPLHAHGWYWDGQTSIHYCRHTGEVTVDVPAGVNLTSIYIESASGIFLNHQEAWNLQGSFDTHSESGIFKTTFGSSFGSISFGHIARLGLSEAFVANDLMVAGSLEGGGDLGEVDFIGCIPEPSTLGLVLLAVICHGVFTRQPLTRREG